jgi:hypothetical protein
MASTTLRCPNHPILTLSINIFFVREWVRLTTTLAGQETMVIEPEGSITSRMIFDTLISIRIDRYLISIRSININTYRIFIDIF